MTRTEFELSLSLQAPLLTHAAGTLSLGVDAATQRHRGQPVLNGSQLRGHLRHLLQHFADELAAAGDGSKLNDKHIQRWFGPSTGSDDFDGRGALGFDFYWYPRHPPAEEQRQPLRHRVELGGDGAAEEGQLSVIENAYPTGAEIDFVGVIEVDFRAQAQAAPDFDAANALSECRQWLAKAVELLPALGALKGIGYGRVLRASLVERKPLLQVSAPDPSGRLGPDVDRFGIALHLDRPFNIGGPAAHRPQGNRYLQQTRIPGAAIKAVMANAWKDTGGDLARDLHFDHLVVTDALAVPHGQSERPPALPLSLAAMDGAEGPCVRDLAIIDQPCLLDLGTGAGAPRFLPDWKEPDRNAAQTAWLGAVPTPVPALLSVRTAIMPWERVADEGRLFALECTDVQQHHWCADIDLSLIPRAARAEVCNKLLDLFRGGLSRLGKTAARARVEPRAAPFKAVNAITPAAPIIVLLNAPARLLPDDLRLSGINADDALERHYADYWDKQSQGLVTLGHYYAQQELVGGRYYQLCIAKTPKQYTPVWLTTTGSVFVLQPTAKADAKALAELLAQWQASGLPPLGGAEGSAFANNPYLRENGYGEVYVDHPLHRQLAPAAHEIHPLT
jgi:hypothetical protein